MIFINCSDIKGHDGESKLSHGFYTANICNTNTQNNVVTFLRWREGRNWF